jgi:hypothetical protein
VTDYESGKLIRAASAVFVPTQDPSTGERDVVAYQNKAAATSAAASRGASILTWDEVREQARGMGN